MWTFTEKGFYSVVADRDQPNKFVWVRARTENDIKVAAAVMRAEYINNPRADYPWRTKVTHEQWAEFLTHTAKAVDYTNYKNRVALHDKSRASLYSEVWSTMARLGTGWGGAPAATTFDGFPEMPDTPESLRFERLWWVECTLEDYIHDFDEGASTEEAAIDIITDVLTLARREGFDAERIVEFALMHLNDEHANPDTPL